MQKSALKCSLICVLLLIPLSIYASQTFVEGQDYDRLPAEMRNNKVVAQLIANDPNKMQLLFFFSFGCPACARFDPYFETWLAAQNTRNLVVYRFPVSFEDSWANLAKMYYVMQNLKPKKNLNAEIFDAIHKDNIDLSQESAMRDFFVKHGYSAQEFNNLYNSYVVEAQAKRADAVSLAYHINQTPTIVINGPSASYLLSFQDDEGPDHLLEAVSYVIAAQEK